LENHCRNREAALQRGARTEGAPNRADAAGLRRTFDGLDRHGARFDRQHETAT